VGTVDIGGNGEGAVTGKDGLVYVNLEDKNEIAAFDPKTLEVKRHLPLESITAPTGLAVDTKDNRLFVGGHNKTVAVIDGTSGSKSPAFPPGLVPMQRASTSAREGSLYRMAKETLRLSNKSPRINMRPWSPWLRNRVPRPLL
jgi:DNA-binding beta-propeller fold protein YncE